MSNQVILWAMLLPWLTLFFMDREDIKRFMPMALLTAVTGAIIVEAGITLQLWGVRETLYPLNQIPPYIYGAVPAFTIWIFKLTYGRFGLYVATNAVVDLGFAYIVLPWLVTRGIFEFLSSSLLVYLINIGHEFALYGYQMWQEGIFTRSEKSTYAANLQPVAAKPLPPEDDSNK
ncbi:hypothetical protein [Sporomusa aerivorans]|uniref:hypothetical protein n=1 Tax=Sporomusa aerivorans TaxID=204936 RepID=UPI00352B0F0B